MVSVKSITYLFAEEVLFHNSVDFNLFHCSPQKHHFKPYTVILQDENSKLSFLSCRNYLLDAIKFRDMNTRGIRCNATVCRGIRISLRVNDISIRGGI